MFISATESRSRPVLQNAAGLARSAHVCGRFLQADPLGYDDGPNMYNYAGGDPVNKTDPSGLVACSGGTLAVKTGTRIATCYKTGDGSNRVSSGFAISGPPGGFASGVGGAFSAGIASSYGWAGSAAPASVSSAVGYSGKDPEAIELACVGPLVIPCAGKLAVDVTTILFGGYILSDHPQPLFNKPPADAADPRGAKAPGRPGPEDGYKPPKRGQPTWGRAPNGGYGWIDAGGRVWVPSGPQGHPNAHGGPHWDVQNPGGGYENVRPRRPR